MHLLVISDIVKSKPWRFNKQSMILWYDFDLFWQYAFLDKEYLFALSFIINTP